MTKYPTMALLVSLALTACSIPTGVYTLEAFDALGEKIPMRTQLMGIDFGAIRMRTALCRAYPGSTVVIRDAKTREELAGESPHHCRGQPPTASSQNPVEPQQ